MVSQAQDTGLAEFVTAIVADDVVKHIGWGTGTGQGVTATDLATAAAEARTDSAPSAVTTNTTGDTYRIVGLITATGTRAITEVGVFDAATGAALRFYADFTVLNLSTNDTINFTVDIVLNQV